MLHPSGSTYVYSARAAMLRLAGGVLALLAAGAAQAQLALPRAMRPATEISSPSVTREMSFDAPDALAAPWTVAPAIGTPTAYDGPAPLPPVDAFGLLTDNAPAGVAAGGVTLPSGGYDATWVVPDAAFAEPWTRQFFPNGLIYRSYLAGTKEPRFGAQIFHEKDDGWLWDVTLGGRVGLVRYGTTRVDAPEGFQIDMEGAAFPRLDPESEMDLNAADFRFGIPFTYGVGPWQVKFAYYHISSHLGDEYVFRNGMTTRFNYARDALVLGGSYFATPSLRFYAEADWAFYQDVSEPWAFQFGAEYSPPGATGPRGTPFVAINGHLRQELDYSGNVVVQAGWQWRSPAGHLMRLGGHYYNGLNSQFALYNDFEEQVGFGLWYDY